MIFKYSYYTLVSCIIVTKRVKLQKMLQRSVTVCGSGYSQYVKYILFALEENAFLGRSKPAAGPSKESIPHRSGPPTDSPRRHRRKEEDPHLHTKDTQEQSLSDYAQQDLPVVTRKSRTRHARLQIKIGLQPTSLYF